MTQSILRPSARARKIVDLVLAQIAPMLSSLAMLFATAAVLGPNGRGELALMMSAATLLAALGFLSLHVGIVRASRAGDATAQRRGYSIAACISALLFCAGLVLWFCLPDENWGAYSSRAVLMICVGSALSIMNLVVLRTRQGLGNARVFRNAAGLQAIAFPALGVPTLLVTQDPFAVVFCWFLAVATATAYGFLARPRSEHKRDIGVKVPTRELLGLSLAAHIGTTGQQLIFRADVVVLGAMVATSDIGVYSVAAPIAGLLWVFSEALSLLTFDESSEDASKPVAERARRSRWVLSINFVVGLFAAILIATATVFILPIVLPAYQSAVPLVLILLPGVLIQSYARILLAGLTATASKTPLVMIGIFSALLSVAYIPFVAAWGITGAAIGSTTIYIAQTAIVFVFARRSAKRLERERALE